MASGSIQWGRVLRAAALCATLLGSAAWASVLELDVERPRSYAWFIGDELAHRVTLRIDRGWQLDRESLPQPGTINHWLELADISLQLQGDWAQIDLTYRLTNTVAAVGQAEQRVIPGFELTTTRAGRRVPTIISEWSFTQVGVVPAADAEYLAVGDVREDMRPRPAPWAGHFVRVTLTGLAVAVLALYLFYCHYGAVWLARWRRPFTAALRDLRALVTGEEAHAATDVGLRRFHAAVNEAAGRVVMYDDLEEFFTSQPLYASERSAIVEVFDRSHAFFFGAPATDEARDDSLSARQLVDVCRRLSVLELSAP